MHVVTALPRKPALGPPVLLHLLPLRALLLALLDAELLKVHVRAVEDGAVAARHRALHLDEPRDVGRVDLGRGQHLAQLAGEGSLARGLEVVVDLLAHVVAGVVDLDALVDLSV